MSHSDRTCIGAGELAGLLGRDKSATRRMVFAAEKKGLVRVIDTNGTYAFFPVDDQAAEPAAQRVISHADPAILEGTFQEIPVASSDSRALVVTQPADSRLDAALRQHNRARALAQRASQGHRIGGQIVTSLDQLFQLDPDGHQTMNMLERAEVEAARRQLAKEREAAAALAALERAREPSRGELLSALGRSAIELFDGMMTNARERAREGSSIETRQPAETVEPPLNRVRQRQREAETPRDHVAELLAWKKATRPDAEPLAVKTWREWFTTHFGTPKKATFR